MSRKSVLILGTAMAVLGHACGPRHDDARCYIKPPIGTPGEVCDKVIGYYYWEPHWWQALSYSAGCIGASGCSCDAECRATRLPFETRAECEQACARL